MYHINLIQIITLSYVSSNIFRSLLEILKDTRIFNIYDTLGINILFTIVGIGLSKILPKLNFDLLVIKNINKFANVFNIVVNISVSALIVAFFYSAISVCLLIRLFDTCDYIEFSYINGIINGVFLGCIIDNKLFKLPEISRYKKIIGYCYFFVIYCSLYINYKSFR